MSGDLSARAYYEFLSGLDIVVLPYGQRYAVHGSGIFIEALMLGKVLVMPSSGWMVELARSLGARPAVFDTLEPADVGAAIRFAVSHFDDLRQAAVEAARAWNATESSARTLERWIGQTVPGATGTLVPAEADG
ncbi:hypothetical protein [Oricola sp.]|uniref:hypothetical protein n=1 Tax=Oricola sp. TaxID=1979950 RepID=UPI0025D4F8DA|nr:hypothetical protein [Oricola sp.]MCI5073518.1 hypothetical protein [Oricola sp.]